MRECMANLKHEQREEKMSFFPEICTNMNFFQLRFEIKGPKLSPTPNFSLVLGKTKK